MNPDDLTRFLTQSLADRKLSGGEKSALADWLAKNVKSDQHRGLVRHTAFEVARAAVADPAASELIEWLEDVMKVVAPVQPPGGAAPAAAASDEAYFAPGERCLQQIVARFNQCRRTADVCVFTITDDRISRAILDAHRRKVAVRIVTDNEKQHDAGSDVQKFREAGIPVKTDDMHGPADAGLNGHMHHKFAVFDGARLINGSYNWTRGAADLNYENIVDTTDAALVAAFAAEFARLWARF
ncbi:phospholipase D-like domain-containing protein [Gemmata sp. JC673]|uniref:phospholipase D n=1 Tax=Gemmata algarum TaxID=2975278 RepID=A0ABU5F4G1_9BACT|nr:phospholipase D-like domain-containing protein [Gemmata algarum]MDY3561647.1 phospholipase D-like domain-containing protein [Gemmata algarum]